MKKKLLSILLCLCMALSLLPTTVLATDTHSITLSVRAQSYCSVRLSKESAAAGETITLTATVAEGCSVSSLEVYYINGPVQTYLDTPYDKDNGYYSFTMPDYDVDVYVTFDELLKTMSLGGVNQLVTADYTTAPMLTVTGAPEGAAFAWYGSEVDESWIKEHSSLVLADTASYTVPSGLTAGVAKYTVYVTADGFVPALRVFTLTVSDVANVSVGTVTVPVNEGDPYVAPVTIGGGSPVDVEVEVDTSDPDAPSAALSWPLDGGNSVNILLSAVDSDEAALSAAFTLPSAEPYTVDADTSAALLAALDGSATVADTVLNAANNTTGQSYIPKAAAPALVFEAPAGTDAAAVTLDKSLLTGLAARDGELNVAAGSGSAVLGGPALTEAAENADIVLGVAPSADEESDFAGIPGTLCTGTGLDVTFTDGRSGEIELTNGALEVYMATPQDANLSTLAAVHVAGANRYEIQTYTDSAARAALELDPGFSSDYWRLETPLNERDSGWRYYLDGEMVTDNAVIGNYYYRINADGSVVDGIYNRRTNGLPIITPGRAYFYPPELGMMVRSCSPIGLMTLEWSALADMDWYSASQNDFTLTTATQLAGLAKLVNDGNDFENKTITLGGDIDLSGANWTPIGGENNSFKGTFDGKGHSISNMRVLSGTSGYYGLFGRANSATIKELTVNGSVLVDASGEASLSGNVINAGGVVGSSLRTHIENCVSDVEVSVTGRTDMTCRAGGIAGYISGGNRKTVVGCANLGDISAASAGDFSAISGGIAGELINDRVYNCYNAGSVSGTNSDPSLVTVGGIVGWISASSDKAFVANCFNRGSVSAEDCEIYGAMQGDPLPEILNCYSIGSGADNGKYIAEVMSEPRTSAQLKAMADTLNQWVTTQTGITLGEGDTPFAPWYASARYNDGFPCFTQYVAPPSSGSSSQSYTVTAAAGTGGSVTPTGAVSVRQGLDKTFTITPDEGYKVYDVLADGVSVGAVTEYTFENVRNSHTLSAYFARVFSDVNDEWFAGDVDYVSARGLMEGTGVGLFSPYLSTSRGMIVTILWRLEGMPVSDEPMPFDDVSGEKYYYSAIHWAAEHDIVLGYDDEII